MRIVALLLVLLLGALPSWADGTNDPVPGLGWHTGGQAATSDMPYIVVTAQPGLTEERVLTSGTAFITITDNGPNGTIVLDVATLAQANGGTGFASYTAGDVLVANDAGALVRLPLGSNGQALTVNTSLNPKVAWGSAGAATEPYVTVGNTAGLSAERAITAGTGLSGTDGGANSTYTIALSVPVTTANGGTGITSYTAGDILTANDSAALVKLAGGTDGHVLTYDSTGNPNIKWAAAPVTVAAGSDTQVQFNDGGTSFGGDAGFVYNKTTDKVTLAGASGVLLDVRQSADTGPRAALSSAGSLILDDGDNSAPLTLKYAAGDFTARDTGDTSYATINAGAFVAYTDANVPVVTVSSNGLALWNSAGTQVIVIAAPAALASSRTYTARDVGVPTADLLIETSTAAAGGLWYGTANEGEAKISAAGTAGQIPKSGGTGAPTWGWILGGDGSAGAVTKGTTSDTITQLNATTFSQTASTTYTPDAGVVLNCTSTATFSGTTTVGDMGNGGVYAGAGLASDGGGPGGGHWPLGGSGTSEGGGGGGGGFGNTGGDGGTASNGPGTGGQGGAPYPAGSHLGGSGGASGNDGGAVSGGNGGAGGGFFRCLAAGAISIASGAIVQASGVAGSAGANDENGGGGGGSGGYLGFYSLTSIALTGDIHADGGAGGAASAADGGEGGGGSGGRLIRMSPSNTGAGTASVAGGQGDGNTGTNGTDGGAGVSTAITGTPNLPIIAHLESSSALDLICRLHQYRDGTEWGSTVDLTHRETAEALAAFHAQPGQFGNLCTALLFGGATTEQLSAWSTVDCSNWADALDAEPHFETVISDFVEGVPCV